MNLTGKQKTRINRYLREVADRRDGMSADDRDAALAKLKARVQRELRSYGNNPDDDDLEEALRTCGAPSRQAAMLSGEAAAKTTGWVSWPDRVWLGVCAGIGHRFDVHPAFVRLLAVALGLVLPLLPLLLIAYLTAFLVVYFRGDREDLDPIDPVAVMKALGTVFCIALVLRVVLGLVLYTLSEGYARFVGETLTYAPGYGWILYNTGSGFFWALAICLPLAAIATLPTPKPWATTLTKVWQACLALYGVWLCYGVANLVVGVAVHSADVVAGSGGAESFVAIFEELESMLR